VTHAASSHIADPMTAVPEILEELRAGRMVVLVDDEDRENEGDIVCAAEHVTSDMINFMLREARGMLCVALAGATCDRLELGPQTTLNTSQRSTAYTVSVDAHERFGISTGVSAPDRARTINVLADATSVVADLARPGHIQPLRARDGGVLVRAGQTEGSVDLCRLAGLQPAAAIIEIMKDDGTMARRADLAAFCRRHTLRMCSVADVVHYRLQRENLVERLDTATLQTPCGPFDLISFQSVVDPLPHIALTCGAIGGGEEHREPEPIDEPVLVRMHSQNLLGDVFGDLHQPSGRTLHGAMRLIQEHGSGAIVYLRHEMTGSGILQRLQTPRRHSTGGDGDEPSTFMGRQQPHPGIRPAADKGAYGIGCQILRQLGIQRLRLVTNHAFQPTALAGFGLEICEFVPIPDP